MLQKSLKFNVLFKNLFGNFSNTFHKRFSIQLIIDFIWFNRFNYTYFELICLSPSLISTYRINRRKIIQIMKYLVILELIKID
jgi:hypothetical protein